LVVDWVAAIAGSIAAIASAAVLWNQLRSVTWDVRLSSERGVRDQVVNVGNSTAREVRLRIGSASDPMDSDSGQEIRRPLVRPGEALPFSNTATFGVADDFGVNITWRGLLGRRSWSRPLT
jgi:hypothetical protein